MSDSKGLLKRTLIYAIGNFGSKLLAFLIVPIYSYFILPDDLGYYDLVITTVSIIVPFISFQLSDGAYRWLSNADEDSKNKILSSSCFLTGIGLLIGFIGYLLSLIFIQIRYPLIIGGYTLCMVVYPLLQQFTRGLGRSSLYAFTGVLYTACFFVVTCLGLIVFNADFSILFLAHIIAVIVCVGILIAKQKELRAGLFGFVNFSVAKDLLSYSLPLIPNTVCWWLINSANKYVLLAVLGTAANGIFSMSNKFAQILVMLTNIFYLAWQDTALHEFESENRNEYFSNVFEKYYSLLFLASAVLVPLSKLMMQHLLSSDYSDAWRYVGFLYIGASFSALCSFLGLGYQISKETSRSLLSTFASLAVNVLLNIALAPIVGIQSASIASALSFALLFIIRVFHTKRYFTLKVNWHKFICYVMLAVAASVIVLTDSLIIDLILLFFSVILFVLGNRYLFNQLKDRIIKR